MQHTLAIEAPGHGDLRPILSDLAGAPQHTMPSIRQHTWRVSSSQMASGWCSSSLTRAWMSSSSTTFFLSARACTQEHVCGLHRKPHGHELDHAWGPGARSQVEARGGGTCTKGLAH